MGGGGSTEPTKLRCALRLKKKWPHALRPGSTGQFLLFLESTTPAPHPRLLPARQRRRRGEEVSGRGGVDLRQPAAQPASGAHGEPLVPYWTGLLVNWVS
uniref:Uncharacterized protein n=1 Tax=Oryza punctata TaxID=4537 RepID=A0A0E0KHY7_ORYPU